MSVVAPPGGERRPARPEDVVAAADRLTRQLAETAAEVERLSVQVSAAVDVVAQLVDATGRLRRELPGREVV